MWRLRGLWDHFVFYKCLCLVEVGFLIPMCKFDGLCLLCVFTEAKHSWCILCTPTGYFISFTVVVDRYASTQTDTTFFEIRFKINVKISEITNQHLHRHTYSFTHTLGICTDTHTHSHIPIHTYTRHMHTHILIHTYSFTHTLGICTDTHTHSHIH